MPIIALFIGLVLLSIRVSYKRPVQIKGSKKSGFINIKWCGEHMIKLMSVLVLVGAIGGLGCGITDILEHWHMKKR